MQRNLKIVKAIKRVCAVNVLIGTGTMALAAVTASPDKWTLLTALLGGAMILGFGWLHDKFEIARHNIASGRWKGC